MNFGFLGKGNASHGGAAGRAGTRRRLRAETARRLGHDPSRHRCLPAGRRRDGCAGRDPHRHDQRSRIRGGHDRGDRGPRHPHVPHRRRGRRARARYHPDRRAAAHSALFDESDATLYGQHDRRTSGHADGVPSPESAGARRRRVRRKPDPARDDRGGRHPARPGRVQHDFQRFAGDGAHRRGGDAHLADGAQNEDAAGCAAGGFRRATTISG